MPDCQFPARKWLAVRRTVARLADETEDFGVTRLCCQMVLDIDRMRLDHMETGCNCWTLAVAEETEECYATARS